MKESGVHLFKSLTSKIHPPLPQTSRQSQQFLDLLSSSFRRQLDKQHPPIQSAEKPAAASDKNAESLTSTDKHMRSILDHPLFTPPKPAVSAPKTVKSRDGPAAQLAVTNPLLCLDKALAAGTADFETFQQCIRSHWFSMLGMPNVEFRQKLRTSGISQRIDSWLLSSEPESRGQLHGSRRAVALLMPYLVGENRQSTVLGWMKGMRDFRANDDSSVPVPFSRYEAYIISEYVPAEVKYGTIKRAMQFYIRLHKLVVFQDGQKHDSSTAPPKIDFLARQVVSSEHTKLIEAELFDGFCRLFKGYQNDMSFWAAFLPVYHPTTPTAGPALEFLRSPDIMKPEYRTPLLCQLSLAAAELCIKQERHADATWLIKYTKHLLPPTTAQKTFIPLSKEILSPSDITRRLTPALG